MIIWQQLLLLVPMTVFVTLVTYTVNYLDANDLQRKLMTTIKKLKIYFATILTGTIFFTFLLTLIIAIQNKFIIETIDKYLLIAGFIMCLTILLITSTILWFANTIFTMKPTYETFIKNDLRKWNIVKPIGKKGLLLKNKKDYKFIENYYGLNIKEAPLRNDWRKSFYRPNKAFYYTLLLLIIVFIISIIPLSFSLFSNLQTGVILILISIITFINIVVISVNYLMYKKHPNLMN